MKDCTISTGVGIIYLGSKFRCPAPCQIISRISIEIVAAYLFIKFAKLFIYS